MKRVKKIGECVHLVDERNTDLGISKLVGLTIEKRYIPSVANIIGTDLSKYKIIRKGRFACSLMQVSRDEKMPVAMFANDEPAIISPAYPMFEVNDSEELLPEYLNMYLMRKEFDREAVFLAVGGVRGSLEWEDFMNIEMPLPDIDEQNKIVEEYQALESKIECNSRYVEKLEHLAETIYEHVFGDNIEPEKIPEGWQEIRLGSLCDKNTKNLSLKGKFDKILYLDTGSVTNNFFDLYQVLRRDEDVIPSRARRKVEYNDIVYSTVRPNLLHYGIIKGDVKEVIVSTGFAVIRSKDKKISNELLYMFLTHKKATEKLNGIAAMSTTTYPSLNIEDIENLKIAVPDDFENKAEKINRELVIIFDTIHEVNKEILYLRKALKLLQDKLM